jgi:hypothetical protein
MPVYFWGKQITSVSKQIAHESTYGLLQDEINGLLYVEYYLKTVFGLYRAVGQ